MELNKVTVYRITHIENIPYILKHGITHKDSPNRHQDFKDIGDISLINKRSKTQVQVNNGDFSLSNCESVILGDYIPFYFGVKMPMLYVAQHGGNFVEKAHPPEDIVYITCFLQKIISNVIKFYFTDGHATDRFTCFYNKEKIDELVNIIDWKAVKSSFWGGSENLNIKRKKQAELLVQGDISPEYIKGYRCYNDKAKDKLISMSVSEDIIKISRDSYY